MTNLHDLLPFTNYAAAQTDRWLFIVTLLLFAIFTAQVLRYLVRKHDSLILDHQQSREDYHRSLRTLVQEQSAANQKLIACLETNTRVLEECRDELRLSRLERNHP